MTNQDIKERCVYCSQSFKNLKRHLFNYHEIGKQKHSAGTEGTFYIGKYVEYNFINP